MTETGVVKTDSSPSHHVADHDDDKAAQVLEEVLVAYVDAVGLS